MDQAGGDQLELSVGGVLDIGARIDQAFTKPETGVPYLADVLPPHHHEEGERDEALEERSAEDMHPLPEDPEEEVTRFMDEQVDRVDEPEEKGGTESRGGGVVRGQEEKEKVPEIRHQQELQGEYDRAHGIVSYDSFAVSR